MDIFRLREQGYNISGIQRITGKDRKTIRKYLNQGKTHPPTYKKREAKTSLLDVYKPYIKSLIEASEYASPPATVIYEHLTKQGYTGSLSLVQKWIKNYRCDHYPKVVIR